MLKICIPPVVSEDFLLNIETIKEKDYEQYAGSIIKVIVIHKQNPYWFDTMLDELYKLYSFYIWDIVFK